MGHDTTEATENISRKGEGTVDHSIVPRWFKNFPLDCKNLR